MVSVLRTLQAEWNDLVPAAQALGIRRVRALNAPLETIEYRRTKLDWLRGEINRLSQTTSLTQATASDIGLFTFGVELEFLMPVGSSHSRMAQLITAAGVTCNAEGYGHTTGRNWKIVTDGSLGDYARGAEAVSPVLRGEDGLRQLRKVCDALKAAGCKVTKKCGLHVHVGASDWQLDTFKNLIRLYKSAEKTIDNFMAPSRRGVNGGNGFCRSLNVNSTLEGADTMDAVARAIGQTPGRASARGGGRYCKLNLQSFWQHGTVEFRHHQGTVEADKAINWTKLCLRMALAAREGTRAANTFDALFDAVRAPADEKTFFKGRADFFAAQLNRAAQRESANARRERLYLERRQQEMLALARVQAEGTVRSHDEPNAFTDVGEELQRRALTPGQV